jgi:hypothetical protein
VQRREHEVPGLGGRHRQRDGLEVAQLADHDDVRILAQRGAQRASEAVGVAPGVTLVHEAAFRRMQDLDRILMQRNALLC